MYKELGEVQSLSTGVNDLKKSLTNIKTRGTWGEIALGNIIEDMLSPEQYAENIITKKGSKDRVEFAIKLPGREDNNKIVYLPIDAKFPQEDYQRLLDAEEEGNKEKIDESIKQLEKRIKSEAADLYNKYLGPPNTTDFGIIFLPTESLFAEVLRILGLLETLQLLDRLHYQLY
ncbi:DNA recombination protein RmuC [Thermoanaerobacterium sp. RBIITD]|uniref:DNA recombination protein RmuC n=1 Tax=Thermoanaerobacterium sp. RBIITD TaxID=1550240 RepID=UPI0018D4F763|nr:DNA recombination protein RmuC [Thermoanaerobacterium sp. RBIITD]